MSAEVRDEDLEPWLNRLRPRITEITEPLDTMTTRDGLDAAEMGYVPGTIAIDLLVTHSTLDALTAFYELQGDGLTWPAAFREAFGLTIEDFYQEFEILRTGADS